MVLAGLIASVLYKKTCQERWHIASDQDHITNRVNPVFYGVKAAAK